MRKKIISILRCVLRIKKIMITGILLTAIFTLTVESMQVKAKTQEKLTLSAWGVSVVALNAYKIRVKVFEEKHPEIKVNIVFTSWEDYDAKLLTMIAGGIPPDVFLVDRNFAPEYYARGTIEPLTKFIKEDPTLDWKDFLFTKAFTGGIYGNEILGIPNVGASFLWLYNKDLFEAAGLTLPVDLYYQGKWDWNTYIDVAEKLTKDIDGDKIPDQYAGGSSWQNVLVQAGANIFSADGRKCLLNTPEAKKAFGFFVDQVVKYKVSPPPELEAPKLGMTFETGKIVFASRWSPWAFYIANAMKLPFKWNIVMPPYGPAGPRHATLGQTGPFCIGPGTKDKALAYEFIKDITSKEAWSRVLKAGIPLMPTRWSIITSPEFRKLSKGINMDMFMDNVKVGEQTGDLNKSRAGRKAISIINTELNNACRGKKTSDQACEDMTSQIQTWIDETYSK